MYYIPKGKPMHEKLSTKFVRMDGLLEELQAENFSGYILLNFPQTSGFLFIQEGKVINAAEVSGPDQRAGLAIQEQLLRLSQQTKGTLSVYYLQKEIVQTLSAIADGEAVHHNLTSDWAHLGKLIKKLGSERRTYFINLVFANAANERGLVYVEGNKVEAACTANDEHLLGEEALTRLLKDSESEVATFSVYRQANQTALPQFDEKEVEASLNRLISQASPQPATTPTATPTVQVAPQPVAAPAVVQATPATNATASTTTATTPATPYYESLLPSGGRPEATPAEPQFTEVKAKAGTFDDILEVVEVEAPARTSVLPNGQATAPVATVAAAQVTPAPLPEMPRSGNEMRDLMQLMSQVVAAVERGMTVAGRGSSFPTALRAGLLAVTERYPFLDPFAAEFEYQDKEIVFVGTAQAGEFASGLTEALRQMVEDLIYSSNGRVRDYIAEELRKVEREQANDIRRFNLGSLTEKICQH
jgi:hypothetical protein